PRAAVPREAEDHWLAAAQLPQRALAPLLVAEGEVERDRRVEPLLDAHRRRRRRLRLHVRRRDAVLGGHRRRHEQQGNGHPWRAEGRKAPGCGTRGLTALGSPGLSRIWRGHYFSSFTSRATRPFAAAVLGSYSSCSVTSIGIWT